MPSQPSNENMLVFQDIIGMSNCQTWEEEIMFPCRHIFFTFAFKRCLQVRKKIILTFVSYNRITINSYNR